MVEQIVAEFGLHEHGKWRENCVMVVGYKGHLIDARGCELRNNQGFATQLSVYSVRHNTETEFFTSPRIFPTKELAEQAAIQAGVQVIERGYDPSYNPYAQ